MFEVTDDSFERDVLQSDTPVVVEFTAPWCGPCEAVERIFRELAEANRQVAFGRLDIDANPDTAARYGVLSLPTAILFDGGEPRHTVAGARSRKHYEKAWASWLMPRRSPRDRRPEEVAGA